MARTTAPRSAGDRRGLVASAITPKRCSATAPWESWSMSFLSSRPLGGDRRHETTAADDQIGRIRVGGDHAPAAHRGCEPPPAEPGPARQRGGHLEGRADRGGRVADAIADRAQDLAAELDGERRESD